MNGNRVPIPPVEEDEKRPTWSVMIPTFENARFLRETLQGVLRQAPSPSEMEIVVVDDCSKDHPEAVVRSVAGGRVAFVRQPENVGHVRNFETCLLRSRGRLVHLLHGDDIVGAGFYRRLARGFEEHPRVGAAFCRHLVIDDEGRVVAIGPPEQPHAGVLEGWLDRIATGQRLQASAMVVRRAVYEELGGFDRRVTRSGEDWEMWVRIAARFDVWYDPEPLVSYRVHRASLTGLSRPAGGDVEDLRRVIALNRAHLPAARADQLSRAAAENLALAVVRRAHRSLDNRDVRLATQPLREALQASRSPRVVRAFAGLGARWAALTVAVRLRRVARFALVRSARRAARP